MPTSSPTASGGLICSISDRSSSAATSTYWWPLSPTSRRIIRSSRWSLPARNRLRRREDLDRWIQASGVSDRIHHVGYVREEDLVLLYRRATLSYYLSVL